MNTTHEVVWRQLTLGHLSRNKFWGEDPNTQYHSVVASSTLVQDGEVNILVDPTLPVEEMENRLQCYCGLNRNDIDIVFATHYHTDHRVDAEKYPNAKLYMSAESVQEIADVKEAGGELAKIFLNGAVFDFQAAPRQLSPNVEVCPLPGHTRGLAGLGFFSKGRRILLSGDTIMNQEFYHAREGYFIDASQEETAASMNWVAENVDLIVPGHGDWFFASDTEHELKWRRLNLCAAGEENTILVQTENENIIINPTLRGHILREALFDARGLDPSEITRVICLKSDPQHTLDVLTMKNAKLYLPKQALGGEKSRCKKLNFMAWERTEKLPIDIVKIGSADVCVFSCGERKIAVASDLCDVKALIHMGVNVSIMGGDVQILQ